MTTTLNRFNPGRYALSVMAVVLLVGGLALAGDYKTYVVDPPINNHFVLQDGPLPEVCKPLSAIKIQACAGEYEPASFVVEASKPLKRVRIEVGAIKGSAPKWPSDAVDVRVVKDYYRRLMLKRKGAIPTLLVHDDSFLAIEPDPTPENPSRMKNVVKGQLKDAAELQPVDITGRRQFWVTVHVPESARPGKYSTTIRIVPGNGKPSKLTLEIEVYPFELLPSMLEYSIYHPPAWPPKPLSEERMRVELKNMVAHGVTNPNIYIYRKRLPDRRPDFSAMETTYSVLDRALDIRESLGLQPKALYLLETGVRFWDKPLPPEIRRDNQRYVSLVNAHLRKRGYFEVYYQSNDEWSGDKLAGERDAMESVHEAGGKVFVAVGAGFFDRIGGVLDRPVICGHGIVDPLKPAEKKYGSLKEALQHSAEIAKAGGFEHLRSNKEFRKSIDGVHRLGHQIFTYMHPPGGLPLPEFRRRNEGLGLWRMGFDGSMTWVYAESGAPEVEPRVYWNSVFRTVDGVVDTLAWEGLREGVDDVRYLTTLLDLAGKVLGRFPQEPLVHETYKWLAEIDIVNGDLNAYRREMARRIIALSKLRPV